MGNRAECERLLGKKLTGRYESEPMWAGGVDNMPENEGGKHKEAQTPVKKCSKGEAFL